MMTSQVLKFVSSQKTQKSKYRERKTLFVQIKKIVYYALRTINGSQDLGFQEIRKY